MEMASRRRWSRVALLPACLMLVLAECVFPGSGDLQAVVTNECDRALEVTVWLAHGGSEPNEQEPAWSRFAVDPGDSLSHGFATSTNTPTVVVFRIDAIGFRQRFESPGGAEVFRIVITEDMCSGVAS
jgi:hypothetical protein